MMKKRSNPLYRRASDSFTSTTSSSDRDESVEWEMRPRGMLVQKNRAEAPPPLPNVRLRIAYGAIRHEISANSQASFGEVKKLLVEETRLQPGEQKLIFRGKERKNGEYLDRCGVKDRSKLILVQDPVSIERRFIETRRNAKIQIANRAISDVSMEFDGLAELVSSIERSIANGSKVPDVQITTLIEMLMRQAVKLDSILVDGGESVSLNNLQGKRVQRYVETLDALKISNAKVKPVIVTTKWETFDPPPSAPHVATSPWEFFD